MQTQHRAHRYNVVFAAVLDPQPSTFNRLRSRDGLHLPRPRDRQWHQLHGHWAVRVCAGHQHQWPGSHGHCSDGWRVPQRICQQLRRRERRQRLHCTANGELFWRRRFGCDCHRDRHGGRGRCHHDLDTWFRLQQRADGDDRPAVSRLHDLVEQRRHQYQRQRTRGGGKCANNRRPVHRGLG